MLTDWAHGEIGSAVIAKERQLRLGVASQLAESLWLHQQRVSQRSQNGPAAVRTQTYSECRFVIMKFLDLQQLVRLSTLPATCVYAIADGY
eukprot:COSAG02_NODE_286_length_25649_cov_13.411272_23_plen_91_part_00